MKYILLMTGTKAGIETYRTWSKSDVEAHFAFLGRLNKELTEAGELVANDGLGSPEDARVVTAGKDGMPVTDGVFPESKEFLLGYWIVDVDGPERAYEIAARLSAGPAPSGDSTAMPIEVRQIMSKRTPEL